MKSPSLISSLNCLRSVVFLLTSHHPNQRAQAGHAPADPGPQNDIPLQTEFGIISIGIATACRQIGFLRYPSGTRMMIEYHSHPDTTPNGSSVMEVPLRPLQWIFCGAFFSFCMADAADAN